MNRAVAVVTALVAGYVVGAVLGYVAVMMLSANTHDPALEAAMTGAFVVGPVGAVAAAAYALFRRKRGP